MSQQGTSAGLGVVANTNANLAPVGSVVLPPNPDVNAVDNYIRANYGYMAWMLEIPELRAIAEKVVGPNGITVDQNAFDGMVRATNWYKGSTQAMRDLAQLTAEDPATATAQLDKQKADLSTEASLMGLNLDPTTLEEMSTQAIAYSWDKQMTDKALYAEAMRSTFAGTTASPRVAGTGASPGGLTGSGLDRTWQGNPNPVNANGTELAFTGPLKQVTGNPFGGGTLSDYYDKVMAQAGQYMVTLSPATASQWAIGWATGQLDPTAIDGNLISLAIGKFPTLKSQIESGITPAQLFDPIKQEVAKTLERSPASINWDDPKYSTLWQTPDPKTGTIRPMTITEATDWARSQDDWKSTQQAQQASASLVKSVGSLFGVQAW